MFANINYRFLLFILKILEVPAKLFYNTHLDCKAKIQISDKKSPSPITFVGVDGQEAQDDDSPSYFNNHEAVKISEQVT